MRKFYLLYSFLLLGSLAAHAQMRVDGQEVYGNEWIHYDQPYYKINITTDGIYRISYESLAAAGIPISTTNAAQYQLFHLGKEVPLYLSVNNDSIEFYAKKNRGELDAFLYKKGKADMLNPEYSLFTDTAAYFLTIAPIGTPSLRYQTVQNDLTNLPTKEPWFWGALDAIQGGNFVTSDQSGINESTFDTGEGYGAERTIGAPFQMTLQPTHRFVDQGVTTDSFHLRFAGIGTNAHTVQLYINNVLVNTFPSTTNRTWDESFTLPANTTQADINLKIVDNTGRISVAFAKLAYRRLFNFEDKNQFQFEMIGSGAEKYIEIENFQHGGIAPILYDLTSGKRIVTQLEAGKVRVKLEAFTGERTFCLVNMDAGILINNIKKVAFTNFPEADKEATYLIITSRKLRGTWNGKDQVLEYKAYRESAPGGGHRVAIVEIEELYDQFAYGIQRHPLSVRNFSHFVKSKWLNARFVLLLGKGVDFTSTRYYDANTDAVFFVPTFGKPASDHLLLAKHGSQVPVLPVGRIAATKPSEIELYLEKLRDYENPDATSVEDRSWRKEVVHLGGGKIQNIGEQPNIENAMNGMRDILTTNQYGANVNTYYKQSTDAVQRIDSDKINKLVQQQGVGMITFFGHGGYSVIDLSIGDPATFTNVGKYPVMFGLGCDVGNIHAFTNNKSYSENFVFQPRRAGIAFVGTSDLGYISSLGPFQKSVYEALGGNQYGKSLGEAIQDAIRKNDSNPSVYRRTLLQQYTLHGDPALVLQPHPAPDYLVEKESVQFNPTPVTVREDSFDIDFRILNIGKNIGDSLEISIIRELPNGSRKQSILKKIKSPAYRSEVFTYRFPVADSSGSVAGVNEFVIKIDANNKIAELPDREAESNNELTTERYIFDKGITPVSPLPYAVVNKMPLKLRASTATVFETQQRYRMAIDTNKTFLNPLYTTVTTSTGGVLEWQPPIALSDSVTYYWRVAVDSLIENEYNWTTSSFTYIKGSLLGWRQGHFQQLQDNDFDDIVLPDSVRQLQFAPNNTDLNFSNFTYPLGGYHFSQLLNYSTINNKINLYFGGIGSGGIIIAVFDGASGDPWFNVYPGKFGSVIGESWAWNDGVNTFPFTTTTPGGRKQVMDLLQDSIPDGNYVLLYTIQHTGAGNDYKPEQWAADSLMIGTNLFKVLKAEGATLIDSTATQGASPYVFLYRKGKNQVLFEGLASSTQDSVSGAYPIPGFKLQGNMVSRRVGPARKWSRLQQRFTTDTPSEQYEVNVIGIQSNGSEKLLLSNVTARDTTLEWIDSIYTSLKLELNTTDSVRRSPAQLDYWQVLYEGIPEAALNPLAQYTALKDTLQEGEPLQLRVAISNLSDYNMDSLLVHYTLMSETNQVRLDSARLKPLLKEDTLIASINLPTRGLRGNQQLLIEINPKKDQPELYDFNNVGVLNFYVQNEKRNPLVDVTFDGLRILNRDIVSTKPLISIALRDENPYLPLSDTTAFELSIGYPSGDVKRIYFDQLRFEPSKPNAKENKATIYFEPAFAEDGIYTLYVNGRDASGNIAANLAYQIEFEVVTASKFSNVFNYPNPFTTSTQFIYTLTGAEPPAQFKIQIMTASGRIVRELTELDLGSLKIGTHRTELAWNGTDQYGDRLANGVYLYRVIAKDQEGKDYEKYDNNTDRFFKKNIGKLVILR